MRARPTLTSGASAEGRTLRRGLPHRSFELGVPNVYHRTARRRKAGYRSCAVSDAQISFLQFDDPPEPAPRVTDARPQRLSSKGIAPGDVVEVDKKGRRFHAVVVALQQRDSGRFELELRPLDNRISYRSASVREVVGLWRKAALPQRD